VEYFKSLNDYFQIELQKLECEDELKVYIISIFSKYKTSENDLSKQSLTIEYASAKFKRDFAKFQDIGDWIFYTNTLYPESLNNASRNYYYSVGQMSYYSCYTMVRDWKLYEQMADRFIDLSETSRKIIRKF
jgi:hypothetical protein